MLTLKLLTHNQINLETESGEKIAIVISMKEPQDAAIKLSFDAPQTVAISRSPRLRKIPKFKRRNHGRMD